MKIIIYDKRPGTTIDQKFLMLSWMVGSYLQRLFGAADKVYGAESWEDASRWLMSLEEKEIVSIQYWGHGSPGSVWLAGQAMKIGFFDSIKTRLTPNSLIWFRTCSTFQGLAGQSFSKLLSNRLNCIVAGHTRIIGPLQGGLHTRKPNSSPSWSIDEKELSSSFVPSWMRIGNNTITCLHTKIPSGW